MGARAALLWVCLGAAGCGRTERHGPAPGDVRAAPAASSASAEARLSCDQIRAALKVEYARLVKQPQLCSTTADCALYGGPECPNELIKICPGALNQHSLAAVQPLARAWNQRGCGAYTWSPYHAEVHCSAGLCEAR